MEKQKKSILDKQIELPELGEPTSWRIFKTTRWDVSKPVCIYCRSAVRRIKKGKGKNEGTYPVEYQCFYLCKNCHKQFTDLTGTPFNKSRLPIIQVLFLTLLAVNNIPANRIYQLLSIDKKTVLRYVNKVKESDLCIRLAGNLQNMGITPTVLINYLDPDLQSKMKYRKSYMPAKKEIPSRNVTDLINNDKKYA